MFNKNRKKLVYSILFVFFVVAFVIIVGMMIRNSLVEQKAKENFEKLAEQTKGESQSIPETNTEKDQVPETESEPEATEEPEEIVEEQPEEETEVDILEQLGIEVPEKSLDWESLWATNKDIYAWIYIPNTNIDYPVLQHETDDSFYLNHNLDGSKGYPGCIYSEGKYNTKTFLDFNTMLYGHNMKNGTMFKNLHLFEKDSFFEENRYVFIYMPDDVIYVYDIFAAYVWDNSHILAKYGCTTEYQRELYLDDLFAIRDMSANFRDGVEVTAEDRILTLVTCIGGKPNNRYLVQGVLVNPPEE